MYRPGSIGIKSLMGLPKTHCAGDRLVFGSAVLRYCKIAHKIAVKLFQLYNWSVGTQQKRVDGICPNI